MCIMHIHTYTHTYHTYMYCAHTYICTYIPYIYVLCTYIHIHIHTIHIYTSLSYIYELYTYMHIHIYNIHIHIHTICIIHICIVHIRTHLGNTLCCDFVWKLNPSCQIGHLETNWHDMVLSVSLYVSRCVFVSVFECGCLYACVCL